VYLDVETTGTRHTDEIIEVGIVDHDSKTLVDTLVKPSRSIPWEATRVHGITDEKVLNAPTWPQAWPQVEAALADRVVGIYNAEFDLRLLEQSHQRYGMPWRAPHTDHFCIMKLYAQFVGEWDDYRKHYRWHRLEQAARQSGLTLANTHRAVDDALLARALLHYMARQGEPEQGNQLSLF